MNKLVQNFRRILDKHPLISNSVIYGSLCVAAEFTQQTVTRKVLDSPSKPYDLETIGRYSVYGTTLAGPALTVWYRFLDKKFVGTATKIVIKKLLIDQFFFTPQLLVVFYISMSVMERKSDIFEECRSKFVQTFKTSCMFWFPAQATNFLLVPPTFRVTYVGICSFAWVNILCWIKRQSS
ncbi:hypothetical protein NQ315_005952 [Exocentrus adspersus]|uniref:Mpv17-like protein n=1 Tax=Exocentrus adspersus TaxID=1586481 RepID=A0AAV8VBE0_9CUCU|nr:hypothetical protein NQ315_005952 [Exocentrus adspersus]